MLKNIANYCAASNWLTCLNLEETARREAVFKANPVYAGNKKYFQDFAKFLLIFIVN